MFKISLLFLWPVTTVNHSNTLSLNMRAINFAVPLILFLGESASAFQVQRANVGKLSLTLKAIDDNHLEVVDSEPQGLYSRRSILGTAATAAGALAVETCLPDHASAAVGTLPEYADTNAIIQGITVNVADKTQQDNMIDFLVNGFDFEVLRKRINGPVEETVSHMKVSRSWFLRSK